MIEDKEEEIFTKEEVKALLNKKGDVFIYKKCYVIATNKDGKLLIGKEWAECEEMKYNVEEEEKLKKELKKKKKEEDEYVEKQYEFLDKLLKVYKPGEDYNDGKIKITHTKIDNASYPPTADK